MSGQDDSTAGNSNSNSNSTGNIPRRKTANSTNSTEATSPDPSAEENHSPSASPSVTSVAQEFATSRGNEPRHPSTSSDTRESAEVSHEHARTLTTTSLPGGSLSRQTTRKPLPTKRPNIYNSTRTEPDNARPPMPGGLVRTSPNRGQNSAIAACSPHGSANIL